MTCDKLIRGITVAVLAPAFGEPVLLVSFEHLEAPDVVEITFAASISGKRWCVPCSSCEARELSLNAHFSHSAVKVSFRHLKFERITE
ncbi:hypothetical protein [Bradyrhizobium sp. AZCC 2289]|uniref:hypothetical protein n=1 Tax=Bradyrhizobium sp. AZCC 2289 TaxID=3117026 RepID=UPI002FF1F6D3